MATNGEPREVVSTPGEREGFYLRGWVLAVIGVVVVAAAAVAIGFAVSDGGDGGERGDSFRREIGRVGDGHGGGGHRGGIILLLILIVLAIAAAVFIARRYSSRTNDVRTSAEAILAERFARGEIDEADYLSRRDALRS